MSETRKTSPVGRSRLTMADLARLAGVSAITVSRALADSPLVNVSTRKKIQGLARTHGYKLNVSARNLRLGRNHASRLRHAVAVIVANAHSSQRMMTDPFPLALLGGISQELTACGYNVLLTPRKGTMDMVVQVAEGMILLGQGPHQDAVRRCDKVGLPMVIWGAAVDGGDRHIVVGSDNRHAGMSVAERFISIGRRHPVFIGNPDHPEMAQRLSGFVEELQRHDIAPLQLRRGDFTLEAGIQAVRSLHERRAHFDAIFACDDLMAMGAIRALTELDYGVPQDVSVIGYDDTPQAASFLPPLSTVRQNWHEGGMLLARKVLALIRGDGSQSEMLPTTLVIRET